MLLNRLITSILLTACLALTGCFGSSDSTAPDVTFKTLEGTEMTTQELRGKVVLVKFWATDCTTCVAQMPGTIERYQALSSQGFETIAVAMKHDPESYVRNFTRSRQLPFPVVLDTDGNLAKVFGDIKMTPTTLLIDKKGRIVKRYLGNYDEAKLVSTINKALTG